MCEYVFVWILYFLGRSIEGYTLGIGQISLRHFKARFAHSDFESILASKSLAKSFDLCCHIVSLASDQSDKEIVATYNGSCTEYYFSKFQKVRRDIDEIVSKPGKPVKSLN
jgi:hypothetical protein